MPATAPVRDGRSAEPAIHADTGHGATLPGAQDRSAWAADQPGPAAATSRRFEPKRFVLVFGTLIIVLLLAAGTVALWQLRLIDLAEAQRETVSFNRTLAQHTSRAIESVDRVVLATAQRMRASTAPSAVDAAIGEAGKTPGVVQLQSVEFYDSGGVLVRSSGDAMGSIAGSARLAFHRQDTGAGPFIDGPVRDARGHWLLFVSRRVSTPSGAFAGIVSATVTTTYFLDFYRTLEPRYDSVVTLATRSGTVIVRHPEQDAMAGRSIAAIPVFSSFLSGRNEGAIAHHRLTDNAPVITAAVVLKEYPLVQLLSLSEDSALSGWRREAAVAGTIGAATLLVLILLLGSLSRQLARRETLLVDLRSNEARLLEAQRIGHVGDWAFDPQSGARTWSPETYAMYGIDPSSTAPDDAGLESIIHPEDRQRVGTLRRSALQHGTPFRIDYRILPRGPDVRWVSVRGEALRNRNGRVHRLRGTVMDITEQKLAQAMSQRVAAIVESTSDAICSQATDGTYQSWNRGAERMLGLPASQALGRRPAELFADAQASEIARLVALAARGHPVESYPGTLRAPGGAEIHVSMTLSPIRDKQDGIVAVSTIMRDVTESRRSEVRVRMQYELTRVLAEAAGVTEAITRAIETLCRTTRWNCGVLYHRDSAREPLAISTLWHDESPAGAMLADAVRNQAALTTGTGLAERVWQGGTATWYPDLSKEPAFVRNGSPAIGARGVLLVPVLSGVAPLGALGLLAHEPRPVDPGLLDAVRSIGSQLGQFIERRHTQEALRESEERFRSLVELSTDWFWEQDAQFRFTIVSNGALKAGVRIGSCIGHHLWDIQDIAPVDATWASHRAVLERHESFHEFELRRLGAEGEVTYLTVSGHPVFDEAGHCTGYRGAGRNITARKLAEQRAEIEHEVSRLIAEDDEPDRTMPEILQTVCRVLERACGVFWRFRRDDGTFAVEANACRGDSAELRAFVADCEPGRSGGRGVTRRLVHAREPVWFRDLAQEPDCEYAPRAVAAGLRGALVVPAVAGDALIGAIAIFAHRTWRPDAALTDSMDAVGRQIGQYLERRRAEDLLRAERAYIDHVVSSAPSIIACIAPDGTTRSVNQSIRIVAGYDPTELIGRSWWDTLYPGAARREADALLRAFESGRVVNHETPLAAKHGDHRVISWSSANRIDQEGRLQEIILIGTDVTNRSRAEARQAVEHAVTRVLASADSADEALPLILQTICTMLAWNCGMLRTHDRQRNEIVTPHVWSDGQPDIAAFLEIFSAVRPVPTDGFGSRVRTARAPLWIEKIAHATYFMRRGGALAAGLRSAFAFPILVDGHPDTVLEFFSSEVRPPDAELLESALALGRQIGQFIERKRAEHAQRAADERLRLIAANVPTVVFEYRLDPDGRQSFPFVSERVVDLLEEPALAVMNDPTLPFRLVLRPHLVRLIESMRRSRESRTLWTVEVPIRTRGGQAKWVRGQSMPKYLPDGAVVWDGVLIDITASKATESRIQGINEELERRVNERTTELSAANRELEAFAYSVSHDLRAPLRSIDGFSRILLDEHRAALDPTGREYLDRVRAASQRMAQLIDDMLSLSRVTRGDLTRTTVDLSGLARALARELAGAGPERNVHFLIAPDVRVDADPSLMRIVLDNLLNNAWKFTARHPRAVIEFGTLQDGGKTVYYVKDDGAGFDMAYSDKLFGPFQRLHGATEFEGTGIGLATIQRIVHRHGGRVWAESAPEQGATFFFTVS